MTRIIAEIGVNHQGNLGLAKEMIDAARACGADAVKFQLYDPEKLEAPGPRRDMLERLWIGRAGMRTLYEYCTDIEFICTPFDPDSARWLIEKLDVHTIKIGSADLTNKPLLRAVRDMDVILSTGMATLHAIDKALDIVPCATLLQCVSAYPAPVEATNLRAMMGMKKDYGNPVGLSDHTLSTIIPAVAVGMGATVIEKHFTMDRNMDGPDHKASLEPKEFTEMVAFVREAESALGDGEKRPHPCEMPVMKVAEERRAWRTL